MLCAAIEKKEKSWSATRADFPKLTVNITRSKVELNSPPIANSSTYTHSIHAYIQCNPSSIRVYVNGNSRRNADAAFQKHNHWDILARISHYDPLGDKNNQPPREVCHLKTARIGVFSPRSNEKWAFCRLRHACRVVLVPCRPPGRYDHRRSGLELHGGKDASSFSKDSDRTELHVDPGHIYVPLCLPACCVVVQLAMSPVSRYADVGKIADQLRKSLLSMDRKAVT